MSDFLSSLLGFMLQNKLVLLFYAAVFLFVFLNRKKFQFQLKFIALYKTKWGIGLMDRVASRYRELVKLFSYVSIGIGFAGMLLMLLLLVQSLVKLFTVPNAPPAISPVLPGVRIPGVPEEFFIPLVSGILGIFVVAVVHEFAHGVVARAHDIVVKSSGPIIAGPIFAAFVEPDEEQVKKKSDVVQYSLFASGPFANILTAVVVLLLVDAIMNPVFFALFKPVGVSLLSVTEGSPAAEAGLYAGMPIAYVSTEAFGNFTTTSASELSRFLSRVRPNESVAFSNGTNEFVVVPVERENAKLQPHFGVQIRQHALNEHTLGFNLFSLLFRFLFLLGGLSLGIGLPDSQCYISTFFQVA